MGEPGNANLPEPDRWRKEARAWLEANAPSRRSDPTDRPSVAVFHNLSPARERALLDAASAWQQRKFDAGYGALTWPIEHGGAGLPIEYERAFAEEEAAFQIPETTE